MTSKLSTQNRDDPGTAFIHDSAVFRLQAIHRTPHRLLVENGDKIKKGHRVAEVAIAAACGVTKEHPMTTFAGRWITTYGPMELRQDSGGIRGTYWYQGIPCSIEGKLQ